MMYICIYVHNLCFFQPIHHLIVILLYTNMIISVIADRQLIKCHLSNNVCSLPRGGRGFISIQGVFSPTTVKVKVPQIFILTHMAFPYVYSRDRKKFFGAPSPD